MAFLAESGFTKGQRCPHQAGAGGSWALPLSGGERPGLTREAEAQAETEHPVPTSLDPSSRPGVGSPEGQGRGMRPHIPAPPLPRSHRGSGSNWVPLGHLDNHSLIQPPFLSAHCGPGFVPAAGTQRWTGPSLTGRLPRGTPWEAR